MKGGDIKMGDENNGGTPPATGWTPPADNGATTVPPVTGDDIANPATPTDAPAAPATPAEGPVAEPTMGGDQPAAPVGEPEQPAMGGEENNNGDGSQTPMAGGDAPAA